MSDTSNGPADETPKTSEPEAPAESAAETQVVPPGTDAPASATQPTEQLVPPSAPPAPVQPGAATTAPAPRYGEYYLPQGQHQPHGGQPGQPSQQGTPGAQPGQPPHYQQQYYQQYAYGQPPKPPKEKKPSRPLRERPVLLAVGAAVIGAIVGGAAGGGIAASVSQPHYAGTANSNSSGSQNITVNNPASATQVTAVAAAASPSVVTINVSAQGEAGTGSGVILTADGYVLTNTHVITLDGDVADGSIQVQDNDGKLYSATVVGLDPTDDLAVIKLQGASGLKPITFADSSKLNVGDQVVAIGAPLGLSGTVTDGIVSALNRSISIASSAAPKGGDQQQQGSEPFNFWNFDPYGDGNGGSSQQQSYISLPVIQTDAAINPGNSGGALLNTKGELIGINVAIASTGSSSSDGQSGSIGVGFAIPANVAKRIADELVRNGSATHGLLGASVADASAQANSTTVGAVIKQLTSGGAADKAGLEVGDIVTNFNGVPITNSTDLTAQVRAVAGGSEATLTYVRDGQPHDLTVTLGTFDPDAQQ